jgi:anti-sigma factor RsiW
MNRLFRDPPHDRALGAALRKMEVGLSADNEPLRQRILAAASPMLAELRSPVFQWWEWISRWMPVAVPVGLAGALAAGLLVPGVTDLTDPVATEVGADSTLVIAAFSEGSAGGQLAGSLIAPESGDWLLQQAVVQ